MSARAAKHPNNPAGAASPRGRLKLVPADPAAQLAEWVDELGALEAEVAAVRDKLGRIETLRALIRTRYDAHPKEKAYETCGARYKAVLGARAFERSLNAPALVKAIGLTAYAAIARPTLKAVTEAVAPHIAAKCITQDYTGARPLKTFPIGEK